MIGRFGISSLWRLGVGDASAIESRRGLGSNVSWIEQGQRTDGGG